MLIRYNTARNVIWTFLAFAVTSVPALAGTYSFQGFETDTGDWYSYNSTSPIQQVSVRHGRH